MTERTYGAGIAGIGWVSTEHIRAYQQHPHCKVVALCSSDRERAAAKAAEMGLGDCRIYTSYTEMLADPEVEIVSICSRNNEHPAQAIEAARAGKHLAIEKPVATTAADLYAMADEVKRAGVKTVVSFVLRWLPELVTIKNMIDKGVLGNIFYVESDYWHDIGRWYGGYDWAITTEQCGSTMLFGGTHAVDSLRFLIGDIVEVSAYSTRGHRQDFEYLPTTVSIFKFANGAVGKVCASFEQVSPYIMNFDVLGSAGTMRDNKLYAPEFFGGQTGYLSVPTVMADSGDVSHHPFAGEIDELMSSIIAGTEAGASLANTLNTHEACLAADISAAEGRPVRLPLR